MKMKSFYLFGVMIIGLINFPGIFFNIFKGEHNSADNLAKKEEITKDNLENELGFPVINEDISLTKPLSFSDRTLFDQTNESWSDKFGPSSSFYNPCFWLDSRITSIAVTENGNMYAAWMLNEFTEGGWIVDRLVVTKWEDNKWVTLGDPNQQPSGLYASDIIVDSEGNLYVLAVYGSSTEFLYKWDGRQWTNLTRADFGEQLIIDSQGKIYFVDGYNLFEWNGSEFLALAELNGVINDVKFDKNDVPYIAGEFHTSTSEKYYVAKLNEGTWQPLGLGESSLAPIVHSLYIDDSNYVYAVVGDFQSSGIAQWDGQAWRFMAPDFFAYNPMYITKIFQDENGVITVFVPGNGIFLKWDGTTWNYVQAKWDHLLGYISGIFISKNQTIYAYGKLKEDAVIIWDGDQWNQLVSIGIPYYGYDDVVLSVVTDQNNTVYAATTGACVAKWDGSQWQKYDLWQWGEIQIIGLDLEGNLFVASKTTVAKWDGIQWQVLDDSLSGINTLYFDSNNILYVGARSSDLFRYSVFRWDSQFENWFTIGEVFDGPIETIITDDSGYLYAGGDFNRVGETAINSVAKWNGETWETVGAGLGTVYSFGFDAVGNLFASCDLGIHHWDGNNWILLGTGIESSVNQSKSLVFDTKGNLYAAGQIVENGQDRIILAQWDGNRWSNLGYINNNNNSYGYVNDITLDGLGNLYLGGRFTTVNNTVSVNFARYSINQAEDPAKDWLLMYYLAGDNDLAYSRDLLNSLKGYKLHEGIEVAILFDDNGRDDTQYCFISSEVDCESVPEIRSDNAFDLLNFFDWAKSKSNADKTAFTIFDHGNLSGVAYDYDHSYIFLPPGVNMSTSKLGSVLELYADKYGKLDVLFLHTCLSGFVETGYEIQSYANYLVASENLAFTSDYPWTEQVESVTTSLELAHLIADRYQMQMEKKDIPYTISIADLSKMPVLAEKIMHLSTEIKKNISTAFSEELRQQVLADVQRFDTNGNGALEATDESIDLYDFARLVKGVTDDQMLKNAAQGVMNAVRDDPSLAYIIYDSNSSGLFLGNNRDYYFYYNDNSHGVSIFFSRPDSKRSFYEGGLFKFAAGTDWHLGPLDEPYKEIKSEAISIGWGEMLVDFVELAYPNAEDDPTPPPLVAPREMAIYNKVFLPIIIK